MVLVFLENTFYLQWIDYNELQKYQIFKRSNIRMNWINFKLKWRQFDI